MHFVVLWWSRRQGFVGIPNSPTFISPDLGPFMYCTTLVNHVMFKLTDIFNRKGQQVLRIPEIHILSLCSGIHNPSRTSSFGNVGEPVLTPPWQYYCRKMCHLMSDRVLLWPKARTIGTLDHYGRREDRRPFLSNSLALSIRQAKPF